MTIIKHGVERRVSKRTTLYGTASPRSYRRCLLIRQADKPAELNEQLNIKDFLNPKLARKILVVRD
jgi:hypothetical protein